MEHEEDLDFVFLLPILGITVLANGGLLSIEVIEGIVYDLHHFIKPEFVSSSGICEEVVGGDEIVVQFDLPVPSREVIFLAGIDTTKMEDLLPSKNYPTEFTRNHLLGKKVWVEFNWNAKDDQGLGKSLSAETALRNSPKTEEITTPESEDKKHLALSAETALTDLALSAETALTDLTLSAETAPEESLLSTDIESVSNKQCLTLALMIQESKTIPRSLKCILTWLLAKHRTTRVETNFSEIEETLNMPRHTVIDAFKHAESLDFMRS